MLRTLRRPDVSPVELGPAGVRALSAVPLPGLPLVRRMAPLGALRAPLGNQLDASLNHVRESLRDVVHEHLPLAAVEAVDVRHGGAFPAILNQAGHRWFTLVGSVTASAARSGSDLRRQGHHGGG